MDELFDPDQTDEALISLPAPTIPGGCQADSISEIAPPVGPLDNNTQRVAYSSVRFLARESQPVEWVKALLNKLRDNRWSVSRIVVYWLGLQGGERGLRQKKRADQLANALLEKEDFFSSVTRHPKIQRWAMEEHAPMVVRDELDQLKTNSKVFGKFDPETSATDIKLLLDAADMVERDAPQTLTWPRSSKGTAWGIGLFPNDVFTIRIKSFRSAMTQTRASSCFGRGSNPKMATTSSLILFSFASLVCALSSWS
jgi:hypothetical protein